MKKFYFSVPIACGTRLWLVLVLTLILAACATPPTEEMNRAHDAVIRAENDTDAVAFAPNILIHARDALTRMETEANAKRYDAAKEFASEAINSAERAIAEGRAARARGAGAISNVEAAVAVESVTEVNIAEESAAREREREEALNLINSLSGPLEETAQAVNAARGLQLDFNALLTDLDLARRIYDEARQDIQVNNFEGAVSKGQTVRSILSDINTRLTEAARAASRKQ